MLEVKKKMEKQYILTASNLYPSPFPCLTDKTSSLHLRSVGIEGNKFEDHEIPRFEQFRYVPFNPKAYRHLYFL